MIIAKRVHLFPSRTQKLSSLTPTIVDKAKIGHRLEIFFYLKLANNGKIYSLKNAIKKGKVEVDVLIKKGIKVYKQEK